MLISDISGGAINMFHSWNQSTQACDRFVECYQALTNSSSQENLATSILCADGFSLLVKVCCAVDSNGVGPSFVCSAFCDGYTLPASKDLNGENTEKYHGQRSSDTATV